MDIWFCEILWKRDIFICNKKKTGLVVKELTCSAGDAGDMGSIPGLGSSPGGGNGNPLQYSGLGNPMERGAWWTTVHGVAKKLDMTEHTHTHINTQKTIPSKEDKGNWVTVNICSNEHSY